MNPARFAGWPAIPRHPRPRLHLPCRCPPGSAIDTAERLLRPDLDRMEGRKGSGIVPRKWTGVVSRLKPIWTRFAVTAVAPEEAVYGHAVITLMSGQKPAGGVFYVDMASLTEQKKKWRPVPLPALHLSWRTWPSPGSLRPSSHRRPPRRMWRQTRASRSLPSRRRRSFARQMAGAGAQPRPRAAGRRGGRIRRASGGDAGRPWNAAGR